MKSSRSRGPAFRCLMVVILGAAVSRVPAADRGGPTAITPIMAIPTPEDRAYSGEIHLNVDASDYARRVVHVHETLSGVDANTILLYPKWLPGAHAPEGPIDRLASIRITSNGAPVAWMRDPVDVYAFRPHLTHEVHTLDIDFDYLAPTTAKVGPLEMSREIMMLDWNELVLYPAGYFVRQIPVSAVLVLPQDWSFATALETANTQGGRISFKRLDLETLVDSPVYAGRYSKRVDLDSGPSPVHLDLFADRPEELALTDAELEAHRNLVQQADRLFGSRHFAHYDFLYSLSDQVFQNGLEHHQSSEDGSDPETLTQWDKTAWARDLLPHEYTHSWNGKFRRPADLWTPNYDVPMQDGLLWVYEGLTQYWGQVLAARSGLRTREQALAQLAITAASLASEAGRKWRSLEDTTSDEIINPRRPQSWQDLQRFEDYYDEGALIWLDADTLIRERSAGKHSLDDFGRAFFSIEPGNAGTLTYTFDDIVRALGQIQPFDWATFLHDRVNKVRENAPLDGLTRGGYKLVYDTEPGDYASAMQGQRKRVGLLYSIGIEVDDDKDTTGTLTQVMWDSPAFRAKLTEGVQILAVNGVAYTADVLKDAIRAAQSNKAPMQLIVRNGDRFMVVDLDYHGGLRYPHLERDSSVPARLDEILTPRK